MMMSATVTTAGLRGNHAFPIKVTVKIEGGARDEELTTTVGFLGANIIDDVKAALKASGYYWPRGRVTIEVDQPPVSTQALGLAIAVAVLRSSGQLKDAVPALFDEDNLNAPVFFAGLNYDGSLLPVRGAVPVALDLPIPLVVTHPDNAREVALVDNGLRGEAIFKDLRDVVAMLCGGAFSCNKITAHPRPPSIDMADIRGQVRAKRAMEIAAAGGHPLLLIGPAGSGKSMLARRLPTILPPMTPADREELARTNSVAGLGGVTQAVVGEHSLRVPHHSISPPGLIGRQGVPGEAALAHGGVLLLDEVEQFGGQALEILADIYGSKEIQMQGGNFCADFLPVATTTPCPCGSWLQAPSRCTCSVGLQAAHARRGTQNAMTRSFPLRIMVPPEKPARNAGPAETSKVIRARVTAARERMLARNEGIINEDISDDVIIALAKLPHLQRRHMVAARIARIALTIADLEGADRVTQTHVDEAIQLTTLPNY